MIGVIQNRAMRSIALLAFVMLFAGCAEKSVEQTLADAKQERSKGNYSSTIVHLKQVLQKAPDNAEARYLLGLTYYDSGNFAASDTELRRAIDLGVEQARVSIGKPLLMLGEFQKVLDQVPVKANAEGPAEAEGLTLHARALFGLGRVQEGGELLDQALAKAPEFPDALLVKSLLAARERKADEAAQFIERAIASAPRNAEAWMMKGELTRAKADPAGALAAYRKVLEFSPENVPARLHIAALQIEASNFDEARKQLAQVRKLAPDSRFAKYLRALMEYQEKKYADARESVLAALKAAPDHLPSMLLAGAIELNLGSHEQAQKHLARVVERAPGYVYARKMLLSSLLKSGHIQRAIEVLQPGLQQAPEDSQLMALAGSIYLQSSEFDKAVQFFEKAAKLEPKSAAALTGLGVSRLAAGETERAWAALESAVTLDPESYQADVVLVMSHLRRSNFDDALKALQTLEKKQPKNPITYDLKAAAYLGKKDKATARKHLEHALELKPTYVPGAVKLALLDLEDKKPTDARRRLEAILARDNNNTDALIELAKLAPRINATSEERIAWLERARKASPSLVQPKLMLARAYAYAGERKKPLEIVQEALAADPSNPDVLDALGAIQLATGEKNQALNTYRKLVTLRPKSALALFNLASAQAANSDTAGAATSLRKALELQPNFTQAYGALARLELDAGRHAEALKIARLVQKQAPESPLGFEIEGDSLMAQKKYLDAAKAYEVAYGKNESGSLVIQMHSAYLQGGKSDEAEARLERWLKVAPDDLVVRLYAADASRKAGQYKKAIEQYESLLQKQPDHFVALNNLALTYHQVKDTRAVATAERAYKLKPDSAAVADTLGWILVEQGDPKRGLELLEKALRAAPKASEIRYHLAQALVKSGDRAKARQELEKVLADAPASPYAKDAKQLLADLNG